MSEFLLAPVKGCWYFCYWHWPECWGFSCVKSSGSGLHFLSLVSALGIGRHINGQLLKSSKLECSCQRGGKHCMYMYYVSMCVTVNRLQKGKQLRTCTCMYCSTFLPSKYILKISLLASFSLSSLRFLHKGDHSLCTVPFISLPLFFFLHQFMIT